MHLEQGGAGDRGGSHLRSSDVDADAQLGQVVLLLHPGSRNATGRYKPVGQRLGSVKCPAMDRRLASRNIRTALIAGAISLILFALAFVAAYLY